MKHVAMVAVAISLIGGGLLRLNRWRNAHPHQLMIQPTSAITATSPPNRPVSMPTAIESSPSVVPPIADFKNRITKKRFGQYISPVTSPIQPERFTGFHTGVDVEYGDVTADVPIVAVVDATVVRTGWVSGYGGLLVLQGKLAGKSAYLLYGHVRESSLPAVGTHVHQGEQIGLLGTAHSHETDGERRHLHFAIYLKSPVDIRGYVPNHTALVDWADPLNYYP